MKIYYIPVLNYRDGRNELKKLVRLRENDDIKTGYNCQVLYYRERNFVVHFVPISNLDRWKIGRHSAIEVSSIEQLNKLEGKGNGEKL